MFLYVLRLIVKSALSLRYRIRVTGLNECIARGTRGVLFLPNHPALIDPVILSTVLYPAFRPRPLVNEKQVRASALKYIKDRIRLLCLPDMEIAGKAGRNLILQQIDACVEALRNGDNLMFYPAGRIYRCRRENLRGNGGVHRILQAYPDVRIVLVRTRGLWGSEFSRSKGYQISFGECIHRHLWHVLVNLIFFMPRRQVDIELAECPEDFPRNREKEILNRYLEAFYNQAETGNLYVPYCWYERGGARCIPDPDGSRPVDDTAAIPEAVRNQVFARLHAMVDKKIIKNLDMLRTDLALEYDQINEICRWIEEQFKVKINHPENLKTVYSLLMAAAGEENRAEMLKPVDPAWFLGGEETRAEVLNRNDIAECLIQMLRENPDRPVVADQTEGVLTLRQVMKNVLELKPILEKIPGARVGLALPSGCRRAVFTLSLVMARKIPVLIPCGASPEILRYCMEQGPCSTVILEETMLETMKSAGGFREEALLSAGQLVQSLQPLEQFCATMQSILNWMPLCNVKAGQIAPVLFTGDGREKPGMVTLPQQAIREYLQSAVRNLELKDSDCLIQVSSSLSILGFLTELILPFCTGIRVVYSGASDPQHMIPRLVAAYNITAMAGDAADVLKVLGQAEKMQMKTLNLVIVNQGQGSRICRERMQKFGSSAPRVQEIPFIG